MNKRLLQSAKRELHAILVSRPTLVAILAAGTVAGRAVDEVAISFCDNAYGGESPNPVPRLGTERCRAATCADSEGGRGVVVVD